MTLDLVEVPGRGGKVVSIFSRLAGAGDGARCSLEKMWHALHFLLTGRADGGPGPLGFLLEGGRPVGEDTGYGPRRRFTGAEVVAIHAALAALDDDTLLGRLDPAAMTRLQLYPMVWEEPEEELREELAFYLGEMRTFLEGLAARGSELDVELI